ncbi:signal peptidase complex catalytic subunit SEC11 [Mycena capillaripes]|nr:signal peptidase complex catalytic subunit SEC11 [Mycena capillaripes]
MWSSRMRQVLLQAQTVALSGASAFMLYTALGLLTNCKSPMFVVLSGSMEPGIHRGDILFLSNYMPNNYKTGDITVYQVAGEEIPIVHRVVQTHVAPIDDCIEEVNSECISRQLLTKGDNNDVDDVPLYKGLELLENKHVVGKVQFIIPVVGYVTILINEYPRLRYGAFGAVGLFNLLPT